MNIKILDKNKKIKVSDLKSFANEWYEILLKGTVDVELARVALGGEWHLDSCEILTKTGSNKDNVWGFNIVFDTIDKKLEYHSLVNIKPNKNHKKMEITNEDLILEINKVLSEYIDFE